MIGRTLGHRYRIASAIGEGGMAKVYRAHDVHLERDVAVKLLAADLKDDPSYVARFVQEAKLSAKVRHPNLVEVFDVAISDGREPYLVMELLEGTSLASAIDEAGMPLARFFRIAKGITTGLGSLHAAKIVHRDLTVHNVMLVRHGDDADHVKVLDLGIAKAEGQRTLTEPGTFIGTLESMSPEQIRGEELGPTADVYALGVLFFRMLTGATPFAGEAATLLYSHLEQRPPTLASRARAAIPAPLEALVARCLAKSANARFADAAALHDALVAAERGEAEATLPTPAVPDLAMAVRASGASASRVGTGAAPSLALPRHEAVLEAPDEESDDAPLELEPVERKGEPLAPDVPRCAECGSRLHAGSVVCSVCGARPLAAVTPFRAPPLALRPPLPAFVAPLGTLPVTVGKRVAAYSFVGAILIAIFGHGVLVPSLLLVVSGVAAAGVYVRSRLDDEP